MSGQRIGYLVSRYPAISHTFILREVAGLRKLGFDIKVASINNADRPSSALTACEQAEEASCFYVKNAGFLRIALDLFMTIADRPLALLKAIFMALCANGLDAGKASKNLLYLLEAVIVARWLRRLELGHLHVHFATPAATVGLFAAKLAPAGFSITVHGPDEFYNTRAYLLPEKCSGSRFLCAISDFASSQLMKCMPAREWDKIRVIPLGVDLDTFAPVPGHPVNGSFKLLCVGRLVPEKGHHILLEALSLLRQAGRDVGLILVGDGPDRSSLEETARRKQLASSIIFAGSIDQDHIRAFYSSADAFVLASFAEGVPVVLMEAMAMEVPCIATWIAGIPELIRDGVDGLLVPPANSAALAATVARFMDDDGLRLSLAKAGRRRIFEKYDLNTNVARLGRMFAERLEQTA